MAKKSPILFYFMAVLLASIFSFSLSSSAIDEDKEVYIVYMGSVRNIDFSQKSHHLNLLQSVIGSSSVRDSHIRSYGRSFNGFAAKLTDSERDKLASMEGVVSVFPSQMLKTQTTRSWDFVGFHQKIKRDHTSESDIIIGSIDTGIWPESESFKDDGFSLPPQRWKGTCAGGENFSCNNKIIGARYYASTSARDNAGHGSHTASIAAGNPVKKASFFGIARGIARGGVPSARIAVYKACISLQCQGANVLAAFDDAIADGVDIITISLGGFFASNFKFDVIAIGSFHAMERGILTVHSVGNNGPSKGSVESVAPWLFSVGATTTDRNIIDKIVLGNGKTIAGYSINSFTPNKKKLPLIYGTNASRNCSKQLSAKCFLGCLDHDLVKGKIVQCTSFEGIAEAFRAGASGSIVRNDRLINVSLVVPFPASALNLIDFAEVAKYTNTAQYPLAKILKSKALKDATAPKLAFSSARGPNPVIPEIMKPDITAPGVEILAAFPPVVSPSGVTDDKRSVKYSILSGTSMACPHVAGVAAYVKSFHPNWSPSAIKSAVMTTAKQINNTDWTNIGEFLYGSGQINPKQAVNPGLVYETTKGDYINLLCSMGYDTNSIRLISGEHSTCSTTDKPQPKDFNYPAMVVQVPSTQPFVVEFQRTVTNVGLVKSTYTAEFLPFSKVYLTESTEELKVIANPQVLSFESLNQKKTFNVTVIGGEIPAETMFSTSIVWSDGIHNVRSPIVVKVTS